VQPQILRIIDANINRTSEGLRFLEDVARFLLNDSYLTEQLKALRHNIVQSIGDYDVNLLTQRDSEGDIGVLQISMEKKSDVLGLVRANAKRVEESLRVMEELAKLPEVCSFLDSTKLQKARFAVYTLEQNLVSRFLRQDKREKIAGLYVILDTEALKGRNEVKVAQEVIQGGAKVLQLRDKRRSKGELFPIANTLRIVCREAKVLFIINDYLDLALATDADGLHIGQEDLPLSIVRKNLSIDKIIGCSIKTVVQAQKAEAEGADYIAAGAIFSSPTKPESQVVGLDTLCQIKKAVSLPVVAIGGITPENVVQALGVGADSVAVISAILGEKDIEETTRRLVNKIEQSRLKTEET